MAEKEKLFSVFDTVTKQQWKETAIADLKGADFDKRLVWKTDEGIAVQPFYTAEDLEHIPVAAFKNNHPTRSWINYIEVVVADQQEANRFMQRMTSFGVTGILLDIRKPEGINFNILLRNIDPGKIELSFKLQWPSPELLQQYFTYLSVEGISLSAIRGFVQSDVLAQWSVTGTAPDFKRLAEQLNITALAQNFKGLMFSSHAFVNAGAGVVQEAAFVLSKVTDTIEMLEQQGLATEKIITQIALHLAVSGDYFFEIAKLRAIRPVLASILHCYTPMAPYVPILSSNAVWSKSLYDSTVNMLRNTTEAMSAILGSCDAILVNPHDSTYKTPDEFSHRIALNVSNLLKEEAYFDKVADPVAGSYYIETITAKLAERILQLFKETEASGGYMECFKKGTIQEMISRERSKKEDEIGTRKKVYVGTNKYVDQGEKLAKSTTAITPPASLYPLLREQRATEQFECLRQKTLQYFEQTGKVPMVYLASFGALAMRNARAAFAAEFFATASFSVSETFFFDNLEQAALESAASEAGIVVMCSADADYELHAQTFAENFKRRAPGKKLILAGYPTEIIAPLQQAGVDDFIHQKTNVVGFISALQKELFT